jgi:hypothetical protein
MPSLKGKVVLEDRADPDSEGLPAGVAFPQAGAVALAARAADPSLIGVLAMRANRAIRPKLRLDIGEGGILVVKMIGIENRTSHGKSLMASILYLVPRGWGCKV